MTKMIIIPNYKVTDHFKYSDFICKCCQRLKLINEFYGTVEKLEQMRQELGFPILVDSGYRCPFHNNAVGGKPESMHLVFAADVRPEIKADEDMSIFELKLHSMIDLAEKLNFGGIGIYDMFVHLDSRKRKARWNESNGTT